RPPSRSTKTPGGSWRRPPSSELVRRPVAGSGTAHGVALGGVPVCVIGECNRAQPQVQSAGAGAFHRTRGGIPGPFGVHVAVGRKHSQIIAAPLVATDPAYPRPDSAFCPARCGLMTDCQGANS